MITTETNEQYHSNDAIGSTSVKSVALNSVAHWFGTEVKSSPAMAFGSAVHANFLEGREKPCSPGARDKARQSMD